MIPRKNFFYAFRTLLGREPEYETVVAHYATERPSVAALRELFMSSAEFRDKVQGVPASRCPRAVLTGKPVQVEWQANGSVAAGQMAALFSKVARQWHHLLKAEPHCSVLTNYSHLADNIALNEPVFYAFGEAQMAALDATLARHGMATQHFTTCLKLSYGVVRAARTLLRRFVRIIGMYVSIAHLADTEQYPVLPQQVLLDQIARCRCRALVIREDDAICGAGHRVSYTLLVQKVVY